MTWTEPSATAWERKMYDQLDLINWNRPFWTLEEGRQHNDKISGRKSVPIEPLAKGKT